jgi:transitional endoplasmic reticulum ATPase
VSILNEQISARGNIARIKHIADDGRTLYLEFANGQTATASGTFEFVAEVGTVLFVRAEDNYLTPAPDELWIEETWVGIVRLKLSDLTIVDTNGRWRKVPTRDVPYREGNTVEGRDSVGVIRVLSEAPLKYFDLTAIDDELIAKTFLVQAGGNGETFDDFGGLGDVVARARELVEVPLREHTRLATIGARPVKGVLFTGPPGVGKTMLARIIANTADAVFYEIRGPEVLSKWYGQSEEILRQLFDHAARQDRAIIFFDEIDSIASHRSDEAHEASRRVVAQLLSLMDGFKSETNIVVIAATNRPQDVDAALRRPGRFDWEITFPLPDLRDREIILRKAAGRLKTSGVLPDEFVAQRTDGWSGAELAAIWTEAALLAVMDERDAIRIEDCVGGYERVRSNRLAEIAETRGGAG